MSAYIKFDGVDGNGFLKLGDFKTFPVPSASQPLRRPSSGVKWSSAARASLKEAGMSDQGIAALTQGRACTNKSDQAIVTAIIAAVLG